MPILSPTQKLPTMGTTTSKPGSLQVPGAGPNPLQPEDPWASLRTPTNTTAGTQPQPDPEPVNLLRVRSPWLDPGGGLDQKAGSGPTAPIPTSGNSWDIRNPLNNIRLPDPSLPKPPAPANNINPATGGAVTSPAQPATTVDPSRMGPDGRVLTDAEISDRARAQGAAKGALDSLRAGEAQGVQNAQASAGAAASASQAASLGAGAPPPPPPTPSPLDDLNSTLLGTYKDMANPGARGPGPNDALNEKLAKTYEGLAGPQDRTSPYDNLNETLLGAFQGLAEGKNPALEQATRTALNAMSGQQLGSEEEARKRAIRMGLPPGSPGYERMVDEARRGATSQGSELLSSLAQKGLDDQTRNLDAARAFMDSGRAADDRGRALDMQGFSQAGNFLESGRQDAARNRTLDLAGVNAAEAYLSGREASADRSRVLGNEEEQRQVSNAQHIVDNPDLYTPQQVGEAKRVLAGSIGANAGAWNTPARSDSDTALDNLKSIARTRGIPEAQVDAWARQQFAAMDDATREGFLKAVRENGPAAPAPSAASSGSGDPLMDALRKTNPYGVLGNVVDNLFSWM